MKLSVAILLLLSALTATCHAELTKDQRLLQAAAEGQGATVQSLIERGASPSARDEAGRTPLHLAVTKAHQATAEVLLKCEAPINAPDHEGRTPLDLAVAAGHTGLVEFLVARGAVRSKPVDTVTSGGRSLKPSLKSRNAEEFEKEIGEPAVVLDSPNVSFFVPKRRENEARVVLGYLVRAYDVLHEITGIHTNYKFAVCAFPKGNSQGWGGTSDCCIEYSEENLDLQKQEEWREYQIPHVSGYIEEMAHSFTGAARTQFGWEMIGWSLGMEAAVKVAGTPKLESSIRATRQEQEATYSRYVRNGFVYPNDLPANVCDRIHAWLLYQCAKRYGPQFWPDFFREVRNHQSDLLSADRMSDRDKARNTRYQITIACFDRLPGLEFKKVLQGSGVSLTSDIRSLNPESPGWNRRLHE